MTSLSDVLRSADGRDGQIRGLVGLRIILDYGRVRRGGRTRSDAVGSFVAGLDRSRLGLSADLLVSLGEGGLSALLLSRIDDSGLSVLILSMALAGDGRSSADSGRPLRNEGNDVLFGQNTNGLVVKELIDPGLVVGIDALEQQHIHELVVNVEMSALEAATEPERPVEESLEVDKLRLIDRGELRNEAELVLRRDLAIPLENSLIKTVGIKRMLAVVVKVFDHAENRLDTV